MSYDIMISQPRHFFLEFITDILGFKKSFDCNSKDITKFILKFSPIVSDSHKILSDVIDD